jgi:hypothetical protein
MTTVIDEAIRDARVWASEQGCVLELDGEVGFGRPCVGVLYRTGYVDTPGSGGNDYGEGRTEFDERMLAPEGVDAYHKHDCLAVLGHGDEAIAGLLRWIEKLRRHGAVVAKYPRPVDPNAGLIGVLLHGTERAVIEFSEDPS